MQGIIIWHTTSWSDRGFFGNGQIMGWLSDWRHRRIVRRHPIPDALWHAVANRLPFLARLNAGEWRRLRELTTLFLAKKEMYGAADLQLTDEMRLSIAMQACLPILNLGIAAYAGWVGIIIYPGGFVAPRVHTDAAGVVHEWHDELSGEAWARGPVVLSWQDAQPDAHRSALGGNVVIHEFAHKLDMLHKPDADGFPLVHSNMNAREWGDVLERSYADFHRAVERGEVQLESQSESESGSQSRRDFEPLRPLDRQGNALPFDPYGAQDQVEFFAVMSEAFFVTPRALREHYPALYRQFEKFYRQSP
jgi:Mlc titration factor MtfA (ptsG expression regulator)